MPNPSPVVSLGGNEGGMEWEVVEHSDVEWDSQAEI